MIKIDNKEIIAGQGPETGVILTPDEFEELDAAHEDIRRQAEEAEAASKEADARLEALRNEKSEKEAGIVAVQADLEKLEDTMTYLTNLLDQVERLNKTLKKVWEDTK